MMQREFFHNFGFLLLILLVFVAGCAKAPGVVERPQPATQPPDVMVQPAEQSEQPPALPVKRGALVVSSEPIGANAYLDDKLMGTAPLALKDVPAGSYRVKMELDRYKIWRGNIDVKHQQMAEMHAELEPRPGALEVTSEPSGAKVRVDGKDVGVTPYSGWVSADKEHTVFISAEGYRFKSQKVTVQPEGKEVVSVALEEVKAGEMGAPTIVGQDGAEMIPIPAGEFIMGSPEGEGDNDERPQHTVYLDAFYIDKYEVTNAQYKKFVDATGYRQPASWKNPTHPDHARFNAPNQPVVGVTWYDAKAYADWAGKRLPTEAEWEKAARGGLAGKKYPWGDAAPDNTRASFGQDWGTAKPSPVGSFAPNGYGLYDMAGNVSEWVADWYDGGYYAISPRQNPPGPSSGSRRVLRGGSWGNVANALRVADRYGGYYLPGSSNGSIGFRCAQDITP